MFHDDYINQNNPHVLEAVERLTPKQYDQRIWRCYRANQLYLKKDYLPEHMWIPAQHVRRLSFHYLFTPLTPLYSPSSSPLFSPHPSGTPLLPPGHSPANDKEVTSFGVAKKGSAVALGEIACRYL